MSDSDSNEELCTKEHPRLTFDENIEVVVGPSKVKFTLHQKFFTSRSQFFAAACSERWMETRKPIELSDESVPTFDKYLSFAYGTTPTDMSGYEQEHFHQLICVYLLADKLGDLQALNSVIDEIVRYSDEAAELPDIWPITFVFNRTLEKSPLRRLLVDYYLHESDATAVADLTKRAPRDFLEAMINESRSLQDKYAFEPVTEVFSRRANYRMKCHYHQHDDSHPSENCRRAV